MCGDIRLEKRTNVLHHSWVTSVFSSAFASVLLPHPSAFLGEKFPLNRD
jgi:hypothetical protein